MKHLFYILLLIIPHFLMGQNQKSENIRARGVVVNENTIKLRWAPTNPKAWLDGRKYGYTVERYALIEDSVWQQSPTKKTLGVSLQPAPLEKWEDQALKSDYAAVIAQAFYGDDFELTSTKNNDVASIINQANELEQRFATSIFMAEYDYKAAELAGWALTDNSIKKNDRYLYRIILNRPSKQEGDTAAVFIGFKDKKELPKPIDLSGIFGDKSVMLSWNYTLLAPFYHSYHVERKTHGSSSFERISKLPVTALGENMNEIFYTDSIPDNDVEYSYRIVGLTSFDELGPLSDTISGKGKKTVSCIPHIYAGDFISKDKVHIYWDFDCPEINLIDNFEIMRSDFIDGEYESIAKNVHVDKRDLDLNLAEEINYVKIYAWQKDSTKTESFPFLLRQTDSIPPAIPTGLKVEVDSIGVAHLSWNANTEPDFRGYRILRSFTDKEEQSSILSEFITETTYADTLSLSLGNPKVFYSISALDQRYNESEPCKIVAAEKPNNTTPVFPAFTGYNVLDNAVTMSWITDKKRKDIKYTLNRVAQKLGNEIIFVGDQNKNSFVDQVSESGDYEYFVIAEDKSGKKSESPQKLKVSLQAKTNLKDISGFKSYVNQEDRYIELSWKKVNFPGFYRLYKKEGDKQMTLWKELDINQNRIVDENIYLSTDYTYTILFVSDEGQSSKPKTIVVNY